MSEAIDIDSDNLCTTEDAFEKFQAVSMYEEDEYITLSDIVSSPSANQGLSEIFHDMPNEDVTSLLVLDDINIQTTTTDQNIHENILETQGRINKTSLHDKNSQFSSVRLPCESVIVTQSENSTNNVISPDTNLILNGSAPQLDNSTKLKNSTTLQGPDDSIKRRPYKRKYLKKTSSKEKTVKRKGRLPKPKNICESVSLPIDDKAKSVISLEIKNNSKKTSPGRPPKKGTKRGRKKQNFKSKKIQNPSEYLIDPTINDDDPGIKQTSSYCKNINNKQKMCKKIRSSIIISKPLPVERKQQNNEIMENQPIIANELTEDEIEDMPLVTLSNRNSELEKMITMPDLESFKETEKLTMIVQSSQKENTAIKTKKRGRPKKSDTYIATEIKTTTKDKNENGLFQIERNIEIKSSYREDNIVKSDTNKIISENMDNSNENKHNQDSFELVQSENHNKRNSKKPIMSDFEYNIDSIVRTDSQDDNDAPKNSDLSESETNSKRPIRRIVKKNLQYDEGSDEDPYANVELSDDEPRRKKGGRYYSDDEYIPGGKRQISDMSDTDEEGENKFELLEDCLKKKSRKHKKSESGSINKSPRKRAKKVDLDKLSTSKDGDCDLEDLLETSVIKTNEEFKNCLAKISQGTDIKIKKTKSFDNTKTQLQIPVLDPVEAKKTIEMSCQTKVIKTKSQAIQTNNVHEVPMKSQVALTSEQTERACEFLSGIVKTTAELGQLMTQKSEDFIKKKINTNYVTDTFKMDYCVKKSFLLFKLAKTNLVQMEEDLAKQYEEFLKENNLIQHREQQKIIEATSKAPSSDSDCEIVEEPVNKKKEVKAAFNPKTVFLNKELSIKIAKKPNEESKSKEKLNIKGRNTVWINDSIMVKKVKPIQSFLAQDSRNKKPPDSYITLEKVSDFFKTYNRKKAVAVCAQFVTPEWLNRTQMYTCCYFFDKPTDLPENPSISERGNSVTEIAFSELNSGCQNDRRSIVKLTNICPESLMLLCFKLIQKQMHLEKSIKSKVNTYKLLDIQIFNDTNEDEQSNKHILNKLNQNFHLVKIELLKTLCYKKIIELMNISNLSENSGDLEKNINPQVNTCKLLDMQISSDMKKDKQSGKKILVPEIELLKTLCFKKIIELMHIYSLSDNIENLEKSIKPQVNTYKLLDIQISNDTSKDKQSSKNILNILNKNFHLVKIEFSKNLCYKKITEIMHISNLSENNENLEKSTIPRVNTCKLLDIQISNDISKDKQSNKKIHLVKIELLKTLCFKRIIELMHISNLSDNSEKLEKCIDPKVNTCKLLDIQISNDISKDKQSNKKMHLVKIELLKTLCFKKIIELMHISNFSENSIKKKKSNSLKANNSDCKTSNDTFKLTTKCEFDFIFKEIKPLFLHCLKVIQDIQIYKNNNLTVFKKVSYEPNMLKYLVYNKVRELFFNNVIKITHKSDSYTEPENFIEYICDVDTDAKLTLNLHTLMNPISLKSLCFTVVKDLFKGNYEYLDKHNIKSCSSSFDVTINCVNTVSDDMFSNNTEDCSNKKNIYCEDFGKHNINHVNDTNFDGNINYEENINFEYNTNFEDNEDHPNFEDNTHFEDNTNVEDTVDYGDHINFEGNTNFQDNTNFEASAHFDESTNFEDSTDFPENSNFEVNTKFKITTNLENNTYIEGDDDNNWVSQVQMKELRSFIESTNSNESEQIPEVTDLHSNDTVNIKIEPLDVISEQNGSNVKTEPLDEVVDDTNIIPLNVVTKQENIDSISSSTVPPHRQDSNSYDENTFEAFVSSNKMIMAMTSYDHNTEEVFTQSTSRVRKQYEPDSDDENDNCNDSLNLLIPHNVEKAKDRLMENSSDEDNNKKKKPEKKRGRPRKATKVNNLPPGKENLTSKSELAILTRRMKEKIRQSEKQNESSGSDSDDTVLSVRKEKEKNRDKIPKKDICSYQIPEKEIQCNDVDSTEQIVEQEIQDNANVPDKQNNILLRDESDKTFLNYNEVQEQCSNENDQRDNIDDDRSVSPMINVDEPVELLECEPTFPIFDHTLENKNTKSKFKIDFAAPPMPLKKTDSSYIDRHGWNCYAIDSTDRKIYQFAHVQLDKLPDSFVETYVRYQDLSEQTEDDTEVDKLTNLNSLNRIQPKDKPRAKLKDAKNTSLEPKPREDNTQLDNSSSQDIKDEPCHELVPSEDEDGKVEDIPSPLVPASSSDSYLAKDFLMNDDSNSDKPDLNGKASPKKMVCTSKFQNGEKDQKEENKDKVQADNLMLTADKMMNKELALLHAPVDIKDEIRDVKDTPTKPITRNAIKSASKIQPGRDQPKGDDSSSEEEKQWFTTKEKLLKRLEKKQEFPNVDDAKRAKIVSEFIEKRTDGPTMRQRCRPSRRRSIKKLLERRKQMKILTRELHGDESSHTGKKSSQKYGNGRRNIRKVLDKKSLAYSTVKATVEEFERKQRQIMRQVKLRETLGCEEGVNVVVINEELCLEYDFEQKRPIVSVHSFFTKVMKAHQYEGVKFMWDVCFETVTQVANGHAGGGCILAHCMGLGKTLQVLALLHTVLTHPQLGMQRVLVCCPLSTVLNWVDEIHKWIGPVTREIKVFELSKLKKTYERAYQLEDWYNGGGIFIIGYELFRNLTTLDPVLDCVKATIVNKIRTALLKPGPDIIICDEGHLLKNDSSVLAVAMSRVTTKRRIVLTGTPMQNNLREYYCMVNFVKPNLLGSYTEYSNRYENPIMNGQHRDSREEDIKLMKARTHILHKVLEGCLQRQEASVLYPFLPKKHEYTVFVSLTKSQRELYTHYLTSYAKETKQSVLKDFHVLQKIWTHPQVLHKFLMKTREDEKEQKIKVEKEDDLVQEDLGASEDIKPSPTETWWLQYVASGEVLDALHSSNKFLVVFRLLDECIALGDKVLIFSTSLYTMDALEDFLRRINKWSLGREYYRLDGSVPAEVRQKWCREFNAEVNTETKLFLISTRAGSLGLNMTAANRVVILDTSWNPAHDIQSIFRVYRFGQKKDCYIYRLVAMGTMEQKIYERSVTKQAVACRVVDEQQIDRHYNMSELSELYRLDEGGTGVSAGLAAGVRDEALLRVASHDTPSGPLLYAVHEHDSLLRGSGETALAEDERAAVWHQFQEEHANKHIQNIAMNIPNKNLNLLASKTDNNINKQCVSSVPDSKGRPKRGRKCSKVANNTPSQPSTSSLSELCPIDLNLQEEATKKIMNILIQHNFQATTEPSETFDLINKVRQTIANLKRGTIKNVDPMTESIAKIVLGEEITSLHPIPLADDIETQQPVPLVSEIETEQTPFESSATESSETIIRTQENYSRELSVNENKTSSETQSTIRKHRRNQKREACINSKQTLSEEQESAEIIVGTPADYDNTYCGDLNDYQDSFDCDYPQRKRRRQKRDSDEEYVPEKQKVKNIVTDLQKPNTRKSNEKKLVPVTPTLHETGESLLKQHLSQSLSKKDKTKDLEQVKNENEIKIMLETQSESKKEINYQQHMEFANIDQKKLESNNESILLSDDDEISETPVPLKKYNTENKEQMESEIVDDSVIPLHKSLLTNKNFIKIVAHTYLSGNSMLDEDAAILAAQYSTLKTLNEMDATGKSIISGPIYDIAVKVLGKDLLMKLHIGGSKKKDSPHMESKKVDEPTLSETSKHSEGEKDNDLEMSHKSDYIEIKKKPGPKGKTLKKVKVLEPLKSVPITEIKEVIQIPSTSTSVPAAEVRSISYNDPDTPKVVPVEMFQGPSTLRASYPSSPQDECILPDDDDDDIIIGQSLSPPLISSSNNYFRRNAVSLKVNSVTSDNTNYTTQPKVVQFVEKQTVGDPIPLPPPPIASTVTKSEELSSPSQCLSINQSPPTILNHSFVAGNMISVPSALKVYNVASQNLRNKNDNLSSTLGAKSNETICLDSDEEDIVPVFIAAKAPIAKALKSTTKLPSMSPNVNKLTVPAASQIRLSGILESNKKIVVMPASDFAKMEASKNKNTQPQTILKPNKTETRYLDAGTGEPIFVDHTDNITTSAISQNKAKCQAGDIIRINKGGKIEILRKNEKTVAMPIPKPPFSKLPTRPVTENVELQTKAQRQVDYVSSQGISSNTVKTVVIEKNPKILNGKESSDSGHTSYSITSDKRPTHSDPLLVLKNVIKIPANKYHTITVKSVDEAKAKKGISHKPKEIDTKNTKQGSNEIEHIQRSLLKTKNKIIPERGNKTTSEQKIKKSDTAVKTCELTKTTHKEPISKVIDLTDSFVTTNEAARPVKSVVSKNIKMSGSSKDFIINNSGTLICSAQNKQSLPTADPLLKVYPSSSNAPQKSIHTSSQKTRIKEGKRSFSLSYQNTVPKKKKRTETQKPQMTLEDFNLDDLDDIIELE